MATVNPCSPASSRQSDWFLTTHWSVVLAARQDSAEAAQALERLCRTYWYPLYVFVRRAGESPDNGRDLTQGFFARLLRDNSLSQVRPEKGKFRSFLLAALKHFMADERDKALAQKRGGDSVILSLDDHSAEDRYRFEPVDDMDAGKLFERRWAFTVLEQARAALQQEYADAGKSPLYDQIRIFDSGEVEVPTYAEVAARLGLAEGSIKSAVSRMRSRYRELVREAVAETVASPEEIDDEIRHLISVIST
jgi:RNA polymerase sigma-70 factor (ECF subfamily)